MEKDRHPGIREVYEKAHNSSSRKLYAPKDLRDKIETITTKSGATIIKK